MASCAAAGRIVPRRAGAGLFVFGGALAVVVVALLVATPPVWAQKHTVIEPGDPDPYNDLRTGWGWHQRSQGIQIKREPGAAISTLRKKAPGGEYTVYAYLDEDYGLVAAVFFPALCEADEAIHLGERGEDGRRAAMVCSNDGNYWVRTAYWPREGAKGEFAHTWSADLDGFSFRVEFAVWDFSALVAEVERL